MKNKTRIYWISFAVIFTCLIFVLLLKANKADKTNRADKAEKLEFSLMDSYGRKVSSQDYKGVPIFLEFGACW
jgi:cytochrome oxidase Cu insertion factor (SCO1/SenC/PrrC family)